jgi:opacity protein-like surface antigen
MKTTIKSNHPAVRSRAFLHLTASFAAVAALVCLVPAAQAQVQPGTHEIHVYAGALFGAELTQSPVSGRTPELDDDLTFGIRYAYNATAALGVEVNLGQSLSTVTNVPGDEIDFNITTLELNAVWNLKVNSPRWVPYATIGVGYGFADLDRSIRGTINGQDVSIAGEDGFTANAGIGAKYLINERYMVRFDVRYRYFDQLIDRFDDSLNTVETTIGFGWRF